MYNVYGLLNLSVDGIHSDHIKACIIKRLNCFEIQRLLDVNLDDVDHQDLLENVIYSKLSDLSVGNFFDFLLNMTEENQFVSKFIAEKIKTSDLVKYGKGNSICESLINSRLSIYKNLDIDALLELTKINNPNPLFFRGFIMNLLDIEKQAINERLEELVLDSTFLKKVFEQKQTIIKLSDALGGKYKLKRTSMKVGSTSDSSAYVDFDNDIKSVISTMPFKDLFYFHDNGVVGFDMPINRFVINHLKERPYEKAIFDHLLDLDENFVDEIFAAKFEIISGYLTKYARKFLDDGGQFPSGEYSKLGSDFPNGGNYGSKYEYYQQFLINIPEDLMKVETVMRKQADRQLDMQLVYQIKILAVKKFFGLKKRSKKEQDEIQDLIDQCSPSAFDRLRFVNLDLRGLNLSALDLKSTSFDNCKLK